MQLKRSKEFGIRAGVTKRLIADGVRRDHIRHELPLDTSSSDGRADIVILSPDCLLSIELKSGKDKMDRLAGQRAAAERCFDKETYILDIFLSKHTNCHDGAYWCHSSGRFLHYSRGKIIPIEEGLFYSGTLLGDLYISSSHRVSAPGMACLLWRDEIVEVCETFGKKVKTRWDGIKYIRDNIGLAALRPLVYQKLLARVHSKYEKKFWGEYDAIAD